MRELKKEEKAIVRKIYSKEPFVINFICSGNIIRSPYAEMLFEKMVLDECSLRSKIHVESGGVIYRNQMISRESARMLMNEGVSEDRIKRFTPRYHNDYPNMFKEANLILVMEKSHLQYIPAKHKDKAYLFLDFVYGRTIGDVPDPYFDPPFDRAYNMIKDALRTLLEEILMIQKGKIK